MIGWIAHDRLLFQATMTSSAIESLVTTYILAIRKFGEDELYDALKEHYSDICSNGDAIINDIIDTLHQERKSSPYLLIKALQEIKCTEKLAYHPEKMMKEWMEEGECKPNAWWAS